MIRLRPRVSVPLAMIGASVLFTFLIGRMIGFGVVWDPWWMAPITIFLACFAVVSLWSAALRLVSRRQWNVTIGEESFTLCGVTTPREQVTAVHYDSDHVFKGTRVQLMDGSFVRIPADVHRPGRVLRAFKRCSYPVK
jgi:hypothetical protein